MSLSGKKRTEEELNKAAAEQQSSDGDEEDSAASYEEDEAASMNKKAKTAATGDGGEEGGRYDKLERLKREKRLAMNRECARARRRRKKLRMELLETRVQDLTTRNSQVQEANDALRTRVAQLEGELNMAKSTIAMLGSGGGGVGSDASQSFLNEKFNLQRRAALLGGGGGPTAAAAAYGLGGFPGAGGQDPAAALRYMQLMQAKSGMAAYPHYGAGTGAAGAFSAAGVGRDGLSPTGGAPGPADLAGMY